MKKFLIYIVAAVSVSLILPSCSDLLDTESPSSFDDSTVYSEYTLAEQTIYAIHACFSEQNEFTVAVSFHGTVIIPISNGM